jgi:hypothetical protein
VVTSRGVDKRLPFDSGRNFNLRRKSGLKIGFAKREFNVGKFEWKIVGGAALGVTYKKSGGERRVSGPFSGRG